MNENELLNNFPNGFPNSTHPLDRERFIAYAVECIKNSNYINIESMRERGVWDEYIEIYESAFTWIQDTMSYLSSKETL